MGLGKTLQSVALIYTLLKTGITANGFPTAKRVIIVCPCSLVKNWDNEFVKWLGPGVIKTMALAEGDRKTIEKNIDCFARLKLFNVLIASYECIRTHVKLLSKHKDCCDLLVCDEAHRLKNSDNQTSRALNSLPVQRRVLLTGTPMQNDLTEFYAMVDFTNPGILGTPEEFRRRMMFPILRGREPDATEAQKRKMSDLQNDLSTIVEDFILRRVNTLNAEHLPPKLVQVVCCNLTDIQQQMYNHLITSKDMQHVMDGKQVNCLASIQLLMKLSNHPSLVCEDDPLKGNGKLGNAKRAGAKQIKYNEDEKETTAAPGADGIARFLPFAGGGGRDAPVHPEWSGKMYVLYRLMKEMRKPGNGADKIVIISNYTQTLDLIGRMCRENNWGFCRLDGSVTMKKRQSMVDDFNDPGSSLIAFLLSSKAGGCGLNLIGGNRLVLFDPDWNPAVDKQAAARCWRDGQKKRCFTYRFLATGTVEEKIFQRQLSKEGLQSVVDDKEQVNALSTKDLKNLFKLRVGTPSDTHDKLQCKRCEIIHDTAEMEATKVLPKKLAACRKLLDEITTHADAHYFLTPLDPTLHGRTKEQFEALVKQPMDFETIQKKMDQPPDSAAAYNAPSSFSKDVNRIFGNVAKVWDDGEEIADASKRLQTIWIEKWTELVPILMCMKSDDDEEAKAHGASDDPVDKLLLTSAISNNERGEDYQEQIGMPDEENMRLWSHHYSTDTVDDPVFRAAMRGTDAVSFVFGLEVTWSNIRARQEAEEEAEAAKAFEACHKDEDAEDGDSNSSVACNEDVKIPARSDIGLQMIENNKSILSSDDDSDDDSDDGADLKSFIEEEEEKSSESENEDEGLDKINTKDKRQGGMNQTGKSEAYSFEVTPKNKGSMMSNVQSTTETDNTTPCFEAEIAETSPENNAIVVDSSPEAVGYADVISAVDDKENIVLNDHEWACPTCTLVNKKSVRKCSVCGARKVASGNMFSSQSSTRKKKRSLSELK